MFIRSERLFLRPGWPEDWEEVLEGINDEAVVCNLAQAPWPYTPQAARDFVALAQDRRHPHFLVTLPGAAGARLVGCVGLIPAHPSNGDRITGQTQPPVSAEIGYWIARPYWGRGYATEAARAALAVARTLGHRRIGAAQFTDNPASARVLAKLGFRPAGLCERWSSGRGRLVPAQSWVRELGPRSDCDDSGVDESRMGRAEAADPLHGMCAA